jgi:monofunctional biosynthetic peptidoglycan transglycosylase
VEAETVQVMYDYAAKRPVPLDPAFLASRAITFPGIARLPAPMRSSPPRYRSRSCSFSSGVLGYAAWVAWSILTLPSVKPLANPRFSTTITVKDWKKRDRPFVGGPRNPRWTPDGAIPAAMKKAVVAAEDGNFYSHEGVDYEAMMEANVADIAGGISCWGHHHQQKLLRTCTDARETIVRKIKEVSRPAHRRHGQRRILELYLNVVELGPKVFGSPRGGLLFRKPPSA